MAADGAAAATLRGWRLKPAQSTRSLPGRRRALLSTRRARSQWHAASARALCPLEYRSSIYNLHIRDRRVFILNYVRRVFALAIARGRRSLTRGQAVCTVEVGDTWR